MQLKNWLAIAVCAAITSSCGENSTKETTSSSDTTAAVTNAETTDKTYNNTNTVNTSVEVPEATRTAFQTRYPKVTNVTWRRYEPTNSIEWDWAGWPTLDTSDYVATYNWDGTEYWTWYDDKNNWVGTVSRVSDYKNLPEAVNNRIASDFAGYTITSVDKENDKDRTAYEIDLTKGDDKMTVLIAENGKVLKKKGTVNGEKTKEKAN